MGPVFVVMGHEYLENTLKVLLVQNEHPIQTFRTDGAHESLCDAVGLWRSKRRTNDLDAVTPEHLITAGRKFLVPIANQEAHRFRAVRERPGQLASALDHPRRTRMRCTSGQVHTTAA
jgi:hypothetical protein